MTIRQAHDRLREYVGSVQVRGLGRISSRDARRFEAITAWRKPSYSQGEDATPSNLISPLHLSSVMVWDAGPFETDLAADGTTDEQIAGLPLEGLRLMGVGQDLEFLGTPLPDMELVQESSIADLQYKEGASGPLMIIKIERLFKSGGQDLVRCIETFVAR